MNHLQLHVIKVDKTNNFVLFHLEFFFHITKNENDSDRTL